MNSLVLFLFATTVGFTASGIVATLYRIAGFEGNDASNKVLRAIVLVVAGPTVLFETAIRGYVANRWNPVFFWGAAALVAYWSLAIGLLVLEIVLSRQGLPL